MTDKKKSHSSRRKIKLPDEMNIAPFARLLSEIGVAEADWDALIIGDGSGSDWKMGCGWAAVLIDHYSSYRKAFYGGWNVGTAYLGELFPYIHVMLWYSRGPGKARLKDMATRGVVRPIKIHIVTDSEILVNQGNGGAHRKVARELWATLDAFTAQGYQFHWHWCRRDRLGLNMLTDHLSRESRLAIGKVEMPTGTTIYDYNPG